MTPFPNFLPAVGTASSATDLANLLGSIYYAADGKVYRLVKASGAIAAAGRKFVVSAVSSGAPTWAVSLDTTAVNAYKQKVRLLIPAGQVGSTGTTGLVDGDYFLAQISGPATALCAAALAAGGSHVLVVNTLGQLKAATLTTLVTGKSSPAFTTHTAATTIAGATIAVVLHGLV